MDPLKLFELMNRKGDPNWTFYSLQCGKSSWIVYQHTPSNHNDNVDRFAEGSSAEEAITNAAIKLGLIK